MKRLRAFTLVELLVAIGIISILISILVPTTVSARRRAQRAGCLSNLRQIAQLANTYASHNKGHLPVNSILFNTPSNQIKEDLLPPPFFICVVQQAAAKDQLASPAPWHSVIEKNVKAAQILRCPADSVQMIEGGEGALARYFVSLNNSEYLWSNSQWYIGSSYVLNGGFVNESRDPRFQHRWYGSNPAKVKRSSTMVLAGDSFVSKAMQMYWTPELFNSATTMTLLDVYEANDNTLSNFRLRNPFDERHQGMVNIVFVDGHAEAIAVKDLKWCDLLQK